MTTMQVLAAAVALLELARIAYNVSRVERRLKQIANALELVALAGTGIGRPMTELDELAQRRDRDREGLDR